VAQTVGQLIPPSLPGSLAEAKKHPALHVAAEMASSTALRSPWASPPLRMLYGGRGRHCPTGSASTTPYCECDPWELHQGHHRRRRNVVELPSSTQGQALCSITSSERITQTSRSPPVLRAQTAWPNPSASFWRTRKISISRNTLRTVASRSSCRGFSRRCSSSKLTSK